jgi:signal transduction histidine kinase
MKDVSFFLLKEAHFYLCSLHVTSRCASRGKENLVELQVGDTGPGIAAGLEQRICDPFFTTKEVGAGTGLGLSITYRSIKGHQGTIQVDTRVDGGVRFLIQLPLTTSLKR